MLFSIFSTRRFSKQRTTRSASMSDETFRWHLVKDFVSAINQHCKANFEPSGMICVDESIVCWYGLGWHWISVGLPHYVSMERKPEDGCEIQTFCCAGTGILCHICVCKTQSECERTAQEEANSKMPTKSMKATTTATTTSLTNRQSPPEPWLSWN